MSMKLRIAALALALAFVAAPALAATARHDCCAEPEAAGPCSSLTAASCCSDGASNVPAKSTLDAPNLHAIAVGSAVVWLSGAPAVLHTPHDLAAETSPLRLSVVRRL